MLSFRQAKRATERNKRFRAILLDELPVTNVNETKTLSKVACRALSISVQCRPGATRLARVTDSYYSIHFLLYGLTKAPYGVSLSSVPPGLDTFPFPPKQDRRGGKVASLILGLLAYENKEAARNERRGVTSKPTDSPRELPNN